MDKIEWFLEELDNDGWAAERVDVYNVLQGNYAGYMAEFVDYVLELEREWQPEGQE